MKISKPLQKKLVLFIVIAFCVSFLLSMVFIYAFVASGSIQNGRKNSQKQLDLIALGIERKLQDAEQVSIGLMFNSTIQSIFLDSHVLHLMSTHNIIKYVLADYKNFTDPGNIILFDQKGNVITASEGYAENANLMNKQYFPEVENSHGEPVWISSHIDADDLRSDRQHVVSLVQKVRRLDLNNNSNTGKFLGYILINIETRYFEAILLNSGWAEEDSAALYMSDGSLVTSIHKTETTKPNIESMSEIGKYDWILTGSTPFSRILGTSNTFFLLVLLIEAIVTLIIAFIAAKVSNHISYPLRLLEQQMGKETLGYTNHTPEMTGISEIDSIQQSYSEMINRLRVMTAELTESKIMKKQQELETIQAQLLALQHQINPHFLYNTLDSINWMADAEGNEAIVKMVEKLGDFLRFNVKAHGPVSLKSELENVENYVYIQKIRYGNRFEYATEIDQSLLDCQILPLTIQPLVENAILHAESSEKATIYITVIVEKKDKFMQIKVSDDGIGMDNSNLECLRKKIWTGKSVGLSNVYRRILYAFGNTSSFIIDSTLGSGTEVLLSIPISHEKN